MPRKNKRPAAKKAAARTKERMEARKKPNSRVAIIGHHASGATGLALALMATGLADAPIVEKE